MFSSPTPAPGSRAIAGAALRNAGLIDRDAPMRDLTDKPGGRKGSSKIRSHRPRAIDAFKDAPSQTRMLSSRASSSHAGPSDPLSIRGASRLTPAGRLRRPAILSTSVSGDTTMRVTSIRASRTKPVEGWRDVVKKRYNPETGFLNLESLIDDELVKKFGLVPPGHGGDSRDAAVIFKLAGQLVPKVQTLSLAKNNLQGPHLQHLSHYLPHLANLSLQDNRLRTWRDLDFISSRRGKLLHLRELVLLGNPIREQSFREDNGQRYKQEMAQRFSSLEVLDQEAITQISFDLPVPSSTPSAKPTAMTFPYEMGSSFVTGVDGSIVSNFLIRFFNVFDNQRTALIDAYDPNATFSFSANTSIATRARIQGLHTSAALPNQTKLNWKPWISSAGGSRNLTRISGGFDRTVKSLHIGAPDVVKTLVELPGTKHDISGPPEKFCLDSFPVMHGQGMGLLLTVHGQFTEVGTEGIRSFDRSFILIPAPEGSRAKVNGWDVVILSDQWTIRNYSSHEAWKPGPMLVQALSRQQQASQAPAPAIAIPTPPPSQPQQPQQQPQPQQAQPFDAQAALSSMPEAQRNLVMQVCQRTRLNVRFAIECLAGNAWDVERAVANFEQVEATLPRDAFV
ncbi:mRNA export factor mex67 [Hypsizygus marmoreus]|uniref:mRNA export factor mex67 n=1 Tax=Hypsizygus marmoreus TaxID=39966 RepID=A0A369K3J6_HYPMA|nr:mRNA export factor mex67 [Hypsizygus marmoreus]